MQIRRQWYGETTPSPPTDVKENKYGELFAAINGQVYCRDKDGHPRSVASSATIASSASYSEEAKNAGTVNNHSINKDIPQNAVFSDTTYTFSEGNTKGSFKVNWTIAGPSSTTSSETSVKIHGLGTAAYQDSSAFASPNDLKSIDAITLGGSSLQQILRYIDNKVSESSTGTNPWG